jgi:hypothetical protein
MAKEMLLRLHESGPKMWITRFPIKLWQRFRANIFSSKISSSINNPKSHFPSRAVFFTSRSWIPSPPWSFGRNATLHLASLYFFSPYQNNLDRKKSKLFKTHFGRRKKDNIYRTMLDMTEFMRTSLPPMDNSLLFQLLKRNNNLSSTICHSAFVSLQKWIGIPKYLSKINRDGIRITQPTIGHDLEPRQNKTIHFYGS